MTTTSAFLTCSACGQMLDHRRCRNDKCRNYADTLPGETWKSMSALGFSAYEASTQGRIRSVARASGIRTLRGKVMATRLSNRGYMLITLTDDEGERRTRTVHALILGTFDGLPKRGQESRHLNDDPLDNRWAPGATREERMAAGGNLMWGTPKENNGDKVANGTRAAPQARIPKTCVRCGASFFGNGRRCHACVVFIGEKAAELLNGGASLKSVMHQLEYPSGEGVHALAVKYGGYAQPLPEPEPEYHSVLQRAFVAVRDRLLSWLELGDDE